MTRLRYLEAAKHFGVAAARAPAQFEEKRQEYLWREALILWQQGDEFGDNAALLSAIGRYRELLSLNARESAPLAWAAAQSNLGLVLEGLGSREGGSERLEAAVNAYRAALQEYTRERTPLEWATVQNNLGVRFTAWVSARAGRSDFRRP